MSASFILQELRPAPADDFDNAVVDDIGYHSDLEDIGMSQNDENGHYRGASGKSQPAHAITSTNEEPASMQGRVCMQPHFKQRSAYMQSITMQLGYNIVPGYIICAC